MATTPSLDDIDVISNDTYERNGYPHEAWTRLRNERPVAWITRHINNPFWAITKHADIVWLSKQPRRFLNGPRLAAFPEFEGTPGGEEGAPFIRHLLNLDPPEHVQMRKLASGRFTPRAVSGLRAGIERIAVDLVDRLEARAREGECDFVQAISAVLPLEVLADVLGVPRSDWELMFRWTNQVIGSADPEYQQGGSASETIDRARLSLFGYFKQMAEERRRRPTGDLVSAIANADIDGRPLPDLELLSYYFLLVVAGNETTRNAMSGGLLALIENPAQWRRLQSDPGVLDRAVEEIVRWTTPVIQFCRTATEDVELRGQRIRAGDNLCLFYPSANRDEEVFGDPFQFRIDRDPNRHIAFGIGEHVCLGANLARLELRVIFAELARRLEDVSLAGTVSRLRSSFVGGIKRMPIRYRFKLRTH
jgi:cytochrome P450